MPINFPSGPVVGQVYNFGSREWTWNGQYWYVSSIAGGGGTGLGSRQILTVTTSLLSVGAPAVTSLIGFKSYALYKVSTSSAAWVRIYTSAAAQSADTTRLLGTDPIPGNGVIAEVLTTGATSQLISPAAIGFNDESPITSTIFITVSNQGTVPASITVDLTVNQLES